METITPEELYDEISDCIHGINTTREDCINLITSAKKKWCDDIIPSEKEIDKKRKSKWDEYRNVEAWNRYSDGFIDAIIWIKEIVNLKNR